MTSNERTLRMYLHPGHTRTRISLEGDLAAGWVQELERCWRALSGPGDSLSVDVTGLESVDPNGYRLLDAMRSQGVIVTGLDPHSVLLLRRIDGASRVQEWFTRLRDAATRGHRFHIRSIPRSR